MITHDLHVHTRLSSCSSDEEATPENIAPRARESGLKVIGLADHMWDSTVPGASSFYAPQDYEHIAINRRLIPEDEEITFLVGCETEYCGSGKLGISPETAARLDFVLIPMSHFHMEGYVRPRELSAPENIAELLVERFKEVTTIELPAPIGIAHPFFPFGFNELAASVLEVIPKTAFTECFGLAKEAGLSIEIQNTNFPGSLNPDGEEDRLDAIFFEIYSIAKGCGCCFHFGSDTHNLKGIGRVKKLESYAEKLGITAEDLWTPALQDSN